MSLTKLCSNSILCRYKTLSHIRYYAQNRERRHPFRKTMDVLSNDMPSILRKKKSPVFTYPEHADIVIIGGGFIGSSVAYWLKTRAGVGLSIVVLEKDITYADAQRNVSLGTLTQHFSLAENIYLSQFAGDFMRNVKKNLNKNVDIKYRPTGSIVLASEKYAEKLEENVKIQNELGTKSTLLTANNIKEKFPWINTNDVKLGSMTVESEGTFNSWALLKGLIEKSKELDATYVNAEVTGFQMEQQRDVLMEGIAPGSYEKINRVIYKTMDGEEYAIKFAMCILAAGDNSGEIAKMAKIGCANGILHVPLPIEKRNYQVYSVEDKALETGLTTPLVMDTTGLWLMRNGLANNLLCGNVPLIMDDSKTMSKDDYYKNIVQPSLLNRVPSFENAKVNMFSSEMQDCNTFDNTGILGPHPYHNNLFMATGFGKLGCQHAPGIGRAIAELIIDSQFSAIDLTRFGFDRLVINDPLVEFNVY